jgi:hypothetical protein
MIKTVFLVENNKYLQVWFFDKETSTNCCKKWSGIDPISVLLAR